MSSFWRKELPVLGKQGEIIKGGMWQHQLDWWNDTHFIKALITGYGGGKTFIGGKRAISVALHNAPSPYIAVSPSYKIAKRTIIPTIKALLNGKQTLLPELKWKFNKQDSEFKIWYRGREAIIWIASGDDPNSLKGPNVGGGWIDEPFIQDEEVFTQIFARVRDPIAKVLEITLTGTPEQLNWGYDICEGERKADYDIGIHQASTRMNKVLDGYADRLENALTGQAAKAYVDGQFVSLSTGTVYYGFNRFKNAVALPDPGGELFVGMDFNVNPMAAVVGWHRGDHLHIMEEIELPNADTEYMCGYLLDNFKDEKGECRIKKVFPDASGANRSTKSPGGKTDFYYINTAGFEVDAPNANPAVRDRENAVNGKFSPKQGDSTLTIDPKCKKLISYFVKYNHDDKNKVEMKKMSHLIDAAGYPIHRLFPIVHNIPVVKRLQGF